VHQRGRIFPSATRTIEGGKQVSTSRKTVPIDTLKQNVNRALTARIVGNTPDYRRGLAAVLEDALMQTGQYRGFNYLTDDEYKLEDGSQDETRRFYY
jgi:hypothetical protein